MGADPKRVGGTDRLMARSVGFLPNGGDVVGLATGQVDSVLNQGVPGLWALGITLPGWRTTLRPASFRGAGFFVQEVTGEGGRRMVLFEFPQRDVPWAEDLGRRARAWSVQAYVLGNMYPGARDALIEALEAPGAGTFSHPYGMPQQVVVTAYSVREAAEEGAVARFTIAFSESGETAAPDAIAIPGASALVAAKGLVTKVKDSFTKATGWGQISRGPASRTD
jgi:prophage DNA circulation protein